MRLSKEQREIKLVMSVPETFAAGDRAVLMRLAMDGAKTDSQFFSAMSPYDGSSSSSVVHVPIASVLFCPSASEMIYTSAA